MAFPINFTRNGILAKCFENGLTIEEASRLTGIPRSSVGYYHSKFVRYAHEGTPLPVNPGSNFDSVLKMGRIVQDKLKLQVNVQELEAEGKISQAVELLKFNELKRRAG